MTQPLGSNYGGIMQAWALQQVLEHFGHQAVTIDRQLDGRAVPYRVARLVYRAAMRATVQRKVPINVERYLPVILNNTGQFVSDNIKMSEPLLSTKDLALHFKSNKYDAVIVGSDQTWRPSYSPNIYNYFLDFLENETISRIAYASSFGVDEWEYTEEQSLRCSQLVKHFNNVSVREDSGVELCRKYLGCDASHVLDPTLLLGENEYRFLVGEERLNEEPRGIYTYFLDNTPENLALTVAARQQLGEAAFYCQAKHRIGEVALRKIDDFIMPDPREWLAGFAKSKYVLTDSFHGMVFSIIFRKPFLVVSNRKRGGARFQSLLNSLRIGNRLICQESIGSGIAERMHSQSQTFDQELHSLRVRSMDFIEEALEWG